MDCSTADLHANVAHDSPGDDSSSSDEDLVPLSKLLMRQHSDERESCDNTHSLTSNSNNKSKKDKASDGSSDDEPLIKMKTGLTSPKKQEKKENTPPKSNSTNNKNAGSNTDEDSDNKPLTKIAKVSLKAIKNPPLVRTKKTAGRKKKESLDKDDKDDKDDSSDDEPLSRVAKKRQPQRKGKPAAEKASPVVKSKRNAAMKKVKYAETSSDSSDDEPLATIKRRTNTPKEQKKTAKHKDSSSDDDVPLENLAAKKKKPLKKSPKKSSVTQGRASNKRKELCDESSGDEPLIKLAKKPRANKQTKTKATTPKKRNTPSRSPRKKPASDSPDSSSDDEPLITAAKHPQVTKTVTILLERCDAGRAGAAGSSKKVRTEKPKKEDLAGSEESSEEE